MEALQICLDLLIDINPANDKGETAIHSAGGRGGDAIVQFLADHRANVNAKDKKNRTPLDFVMGVGAELVVCGRPTNPPWPCYEN